MKEKAIYLTLAHILVAEPVVGRGSWVVLADTNIEFNKTSPCPSQIERKRNGLVEGKYETKINQNLAAYRCSTPT